MKGWQRAVSFFTGGPLLSGFPARGGFSGDRTLPGMIAGMMESRSVVRVWAKSVLVDWDTLWKMSIFSVILLASSNVFFGSGKDFLGKF